MDINRLASYNPIERHGTARRPSQRHYARRWSDKMFFRDWAAKHHTGIQEIVRYRLSRYFQNARCSRHHANNIIPGSHPRRDLPICTCPTARGVTHSGKKIELTLLMLKVYVLSENDHGDAVLVPAKQEASAKTASCKGRAWSNVVVRIDHHVGRH